MVVSIWDKLDASPPPANAEVVTRPSSESRKWNKPTRAAWTLAATAIWLYPFIKVFIFDIDRWALSMMPGDAEWLLNYRLVFFLALLALLVAAFPKIRKPLLYIIFFPIIVVSWFLPKLLWKLKSPTAWVALAHALTSFLSAFRANTVFLIGFVLGTFGVVVTRRPVVLAFCGALVAAQMIRVTTRTMRFSLGPSRFLRANQKIISRVIGSDTFIGFVSIEDDLRSEDIEKFNSEQQGRFITRAAVAVTANRAVYFWAHQLDKYRRSAALYMFGVLSYLWLYLLLAVGFTLLNVALLKLDPAQYQFVGTPSFLEVAYYTLGTFSVSSVSGVITDGDVARILAILAGLAGPLLLLSMGLNAFFTFREQRQEEAFSDAVSDLRTTGSRLDSLIVAEYQVSPSEAIEKLQEMSTFLSGFAAYLMTHTPHEFFDSSTDG